MRPWSLHRVVSGTTRTWIFMGNKARFETAVNVLAAGHLLGGPPIALYPFKFIFLFNAVKCSSQMLHSLERCYFNVKVTLVLHYVYNMDLTTWCFNTW